VCGLTEPYMGQYLTTLNFFTLSTTQQNTAVLASTTFVKQLAEHLNTSTGSLGCISDTDNLNLFTNLNNTTL